MRLMGMEQNCRDGPLRNEIGEIRDLLLAISFKIRQSREEYNAGAVGGSTNVLQRVTSADQEVRELLKVLAKKIRDCKEQLTAQRVDHALYGLQGMDKIYPEAREVLVALDETA